MNRRKGDVIISAVLIAGITIALISTAYLWGKPIIEKRSSVTTFLAAREFINSFNERAEEITNRESGEFDLAIPLGSVELIQYESANPTTTNTIRIKFPVAQPLSEEGQIVYLGATSFKDLTNETGTYGDSSPFVITMETESTGSGTFFTTISSHARRLTTPTREFLIVMEEGTVSGGEGILSVSFKRVDTVQGGATNGGELLKTVLRVSAA